MSADRARLRAPRPSAAPILGEPLGRVAAAPDLARCWPLMAFLACPLPAAVLAAAAVITTPDPTSSGVLFFPVGIYILMALGLNIVVGHAGLLDLGYVAFFAVGAYTTAWLGTHHATLPSGAVRARSAVVVAMPPASSARPPTLRLRGDYLAIVTLGFGEIVRITAQNLKWLGGAAASSNIPRPPSFLGLKFGVLDPKPYYWLVLAVIIVIVISCTASSAAGSAGPGRRSGRTRTPPSSWACPRSSSSCGPSPSAPPSAAWPADSTPPSPAHQPRHVPADPVDPDPRRRRARRRWATCPA